MRAEFLRPSQHYRLEGHKGGPQLGPHYAERRYVSRTAEILADLVRDANFKTRKLIRCNSISDINPSEYLFLYRVEKRNTS